MSSKVEQAVRGILARFGSKTGAEPYTDEQIAEALNSGIEWLGEKLERGREAKHRAKLTSEAMQALIGAHHSFNAETIAERSVQVADAIMAELKRKSEAGGANAD